MLLLSPVLESHQHVDCGKIQLDDVLLSCLKVFFIVNRGFLLHHSDVSRRDLEAEEVPEACLKSPGSQACPGEVPLMQTPWLHCRRASVHLTPLQSSAPALTGHHLSWAQDPYLRKAQKALFLFRAIITHLLSFGYIFTYLRTLLNRAQREQNSARSRANLPEGFLRHWQDLPGVSLAKNLLHLGRL